MIRGSSSPAGSSHGLPRRMEIHEIHGIMKFHSDQSIPTYDPFAGFKVILIYRDLLHEKTLRGGRHLRS